MMISNAEKLYEDDSCLDDANNGDYKMDTSSNAKLNGGNFGEGDASTSKVTKNNSKDQKKPRHKKMKGSLIDKCFANGIEYNVGETIYIADKNDQYDSPYNICLLHKISMNKRSIHIKRLYRANELPEPTYHTYKTKLKLDRLMEKWTRSRELFVSEISVLDRVPLSGLRGKCIVMDCQDSINDVSKFVPRDDTFFSFFSYNPMNRRLAQRGRICLDATHQANLPEFTPDVPVEERTDPAKYEDMIWEPGRIHDHDLLMYLRACHSIADLETWVDKKMVENQLAMHDGETLESPDNGFLVATKDGIGLNAIQKLHDSGYDTGKALQLFLKTPFPKYGVVDTCRKWPEEDLNKFIKGVKIYGKNFFKIHQELLPHRGTPKKIVEFYYLWKETPGAFRKWPRGRRPRPGNLGRQKNGGKSTGKNNLDKDSDYLSSCSDPNVLDEAKDKGTKNDDSVSSPPALSNHYCRHCYTLESKNWHHAGKDNLLSCLDCQLYFKKYGEFPCLDPNESCNDYISESSEEEAEVTKWRPWT